MGKIKSSTNQFAKDCIYTALMMLMEEKDFEEITITEIADRAGVSRVTYYRNYESREDILLKKFDEIFDRHIEEILHADTLDDCELAEDLVSFFYDNRVLVCNILKSGQLELMTRRFRHFADEISGLHPQERNFDIHYGCHFIVGGFLFLLLEWIESGMKETVAEVSQLFYRYSLEFSPVKLR